LVAIIVAMGMGYFVNHGLSRFEFNRAHECVATLYDETISTFYVSSGNETAQRLIEKITQGNVSDIKIVEGTQFVAHSQKGLIGHRIPKDLFDKAKELGRTQKTAVSWPAPETINVAIPTSREGKYIGMVDLNYKIPKFTAPSFGLISLGLFLLFCGIYFLGVKFLRKYLSLIGAVLVALSMLLAFIIGWQFINYDYVKFCAAKDQALAKIGTVLQQEPGIAGGVAFISAQKDKLAQTAQTNKNEDLLFLRNSFIAIFLLSLAIFAFIQFGIANRVKRALIKNRIAYAYIAPATFGMLLLVFFPILFGFVLGFTDYSLLKFKDPIWSLFVGFKNFIDILSDFNVFNYQNFYYTLMITVIWTASNVFLHVTIGLFLALILNMSIVSGRKIYRTLLILPWAVPNYITALIWRGMFQRQFGAINGLLNLFRLPSISWFDHPLTAFLANLATNVWLGIPFMMVIALGALQSIPSELYEAADIDGATPWQKFRNLTLPLLRPAMTPAIILGVVWTFNMFNIIYLVSGGAPYGATDILITSAYRWAFEKYQYGYAAAYSTIIFFILLGYSILNIRVSRATESAYEGK
jgi:ABC-type sugar transport system permease subunit